MPTIREIAKACNVSISTVSNILNHKGAAGEETRNRVLETAKQMNYVPNYMAKNLKQKSTRTIGIITEDLTVFNCAEIVDGIHEYFDEKGYTFLLGNLRLYKKYSHEFYHSKAHEKQVNEEMEIMRAKKVDGIIYIGSHSREIHYMPTDFQVPIVLAYSFTDNPNIPAVIFDDEKGAYRAVEALLQRGHKNIGIIAGRKESLHTKERLKGCKRALKSYGVPFRKELVVHGNWNREESAGACRALMEYGVTAIFAMSDIMAGGVYDFTAKEEIRVGTDLDLIGFDNQVIAQAYMPPLTTMALPLRQIGLTSARVMISMLEDRSLVKPLYKIECGLLNRQSISPCSPQD